MDKNDICKLTPAELIGLGEFDCECGKRHSCGIGHVLIESGAIAMLPTLLLEAGCRKAFILSGHNSFAAAGKRVLEALDGAGVGHSDYVYPHSPVEPTEHSLGAALMHFNYDCDMIVAVGTGVINDIGKMLARATGHKYIIVATAPSMDGFASATSSMERDGLKVSLDSTFPWAIIGDLDVLCAAPMKLLQAGVGDMLAKYISLVEWRIAHMLVGEYYCPVVAGLVENALARCVQATPLLAKREPQAVRAVMEGLVIAGMAMKYAGLSRPASGMEHYFSHIWDMRALAFDNARSELHGIQCGIATLLSLRVYEYIRTLKPNRERALTAVREFSLVDWNEKLRGFIGPAAEAMICGERSEGKYNKEKHAVRLEKIIENWGELMSATDELPDYNQVEMIMKMIGAPVSAVTFGVTSEELQTAFTMTKDIRDKYIASRLLWDLGQLDEAAVTVFDKATI